MTICHVKELPHVRTIPATPAAFPGLTLDPEHPVPFPASCPLRQAAIDVEIVMCTTTSRMLTLLLVTVAAGPGHAGRLQELAIPPISDTRAAPMPSEQPLPSPLVDKAGSRPSVDIVIGTFPCGHAAARILPTDACRVR